MTRRGAACCFGHRYRLRLVLLALQAADRSAFSLYRRMRANRPLFQRAGALLEEWRLTAIAAKTAKQISYGEQRQIDLILAMAAQPKVLLRDEPTADYPPPNLFGSSAWSAACRGTSPSS
jgi:ABC-type branched-subunit amino acid transport system ATPase component